MNAAYTTHHKLNQQLIQSQSKDMSSASACLVPRQTLSGKSLGSLGQYSLDWNNADTDKVSSAPPLPPLIGPVLGSSPDLHPASPITLGQKMFSLKAAMLDVDRAVEVTLLSLLMMTSCAGMSS